MSPQFQSRINKRNLFPCPFSRTVAHFHQAAWSRRKEVWEWGCYLCKGFGKDLSMAVRNHIGSLWELSRLSVQTYNSREVTALLLQRVEASEWKSLLIPMWFATKGVLSATTTPRAASLNSQAMLT